MDIDPPFFVAATGHPSMDGAVDACCDVLRAECRWSGRRAALAATPSSRLVDRLATAPGIRLAAVRDGAVIGLACVDVDAPGGAELLVAVVAAWRGRGVALELGREIVARAHAAGIPRIVMRTSYRSAEQRELGASLGFQVVDLGRGRLDLVRTAPPDSQTA